MKIGLAVILISLVLGVGNTANFLSEALPETTTLSDLGPAVAALPISVLVKALGAFITGAVGPGGLAALGAKIKTIGGGK